MSGKKQLVLEEQLLAFEKDNGTPPPKKSPKIDLTCNGRFRWNLLINVGLIGLVAMPFFVPTYVTLAVNSYYAFLWFVFVCCAIRTQGRITRRMNQKEGDLEASNGVYKSVMATFCYKEPLDLILKALKNISEQRTAKDIIMAVCMEEKTPDREKKIKAIFDKYQESFAQLIVTVHPYGTAGEIPGKCSNQNFAIRSIYNHLKTEDPNMNPKDYFITNFDVDTIFHARFSDIQRQECLQEPDKDRHSIVWQPVLFYNWDLEKLSFFVRITSVVRNILMMGALVPFNINIMSVYTASLQLYIDGDFCHPAYQMDDIICYVRWMALTKRTLQIKCIYCPTISGPTSGKNMWDEFYEWARQIRRWSVGAAEVFHYFVIKSSGINFFRAIYWAFNYLNYYVGFTSIQVLLMITTAVKLGLTPNDKFRMYFLIPLGTVYLCLLTSIIVNKIAAKNLLKTIAKENIPFYKDVVHWIVSPFVMLAYGMVVTYGFFEIVVFGRQVCKHDASRKSQLGTGLRERLYSYNRERVASGLSQGIEKRYVDGPRAIVASHNFEKSGHNASQGLIENVSPQQVQQTSEYQVLGDDDNQAM